MNCVSEVRQSSCVALIVVALFASRSHGAEQDGKAIEAIAGAIRYSSLNSAYISSASLSVGLKKTFINRKEAEGSVNRQIIDNCTTKIIVKRNSNDFMFLIDSVPLKDGSERSKVNRRTAVLGRSALNGRGGVSAEYVAAQSRCICTDQSLVLIPNPFNFGRLTGEIAEIYFGSVGVPKLGGDVMPYMTKDGNDKFLSAINSKYPGYQLTYEPKQSGEDGKQLTVVKGYAASQEKKRLLHEVHIREWDSSTCSYVAYYGEDGKLTVEHKADAFQKHLPSGISRPSKYTLTYFGEAGEVTQRFEATIDPANESYNEELDVGLFRFQLPANTKLLNNPLKPREGIKTDAQVGPEGLVITLENNLDELKDVKNEPLKPASQSGKEPASKRNFFYAVAGCFVLLGATVLILVKRKSRTGNSAAILIVAGGMVLGSSGCGSGSSTGSGSLEANLSQSLMPTPANVKLGNVRGDLPLVPFSVDLENVTSDDVQIIEIAAGCSCLPIEQSYPASIPPGGKFTLRGHLKTSDKLGAISTTINVRTPSGSIMIPVTATAVVDLWADPQPQTAIVNSGKTTGVFEICTILDPQTNLQAAGEFDSKYTIEELSRDTNAGVTKVKYKFTVSSDFSIYNTKCVFKVSAPGKDVPPVRLEVNCLNPKLRNAVGSLSPDDKTASVLLPACRRNESVSLPLSKLIFSLRAGEIVATCDMKWNVEIVETMIPSHPTAVKLHVPDNVGPGQAKLRITVTDKSSGVIQAVLLVDLFVL